MDLLASAGSWLAHTGWLVPLGSIVTAFAAVATAIFAAVIGFQARNVSLGQKEIAGIAELNKISEKLRSKRYLSVRRDVAVGYLIGHVNENSGMDILDFMEEVSLYEDRKFVKIDTLVALHSEGFICWWYATEHLVQPFRDRMADQTFWNGTRVLVSRMQKECAKDAPAWSVRPREDVIRSFFIDEISLVRAAEEWALS